MGGWVAGLAVSLQSPVSRNQELICCALSFMYPVLPGDGNFSEESDGCEFIFDVPSGEFITAVLTAPMTMNPQAQGACDVDTAENSVQQSARKKRKSNAAKSKPKPLSSAASIVQIINCSTTQNTQNSSKVLNEVIRACFGPIVGMSTEKVNMEEVRSMMRQLLAFLFLKCNEVKTKDVNITMLGNRIRTFREGLAKALERIVDIHIFHLRKDYATADSSDIAAALEKTTASSWDSG